ncbi:MAG: hypothetical protein U1E36_10000 [Rickettsiales bacterium]
MKNSLFTFIVVALSFSSSFAEEGNDGCVRGGCSGQSCVERSAEPVMSTCEFLPEYVCIQKFAICERQADGQCNFTLKPDYKACTKNPEKYQDQ